MADLENLKKYFDAKFEILANKTHEGPETTLAVPYMKSKGNQAQANFLTSLLKTISKAKRQTEAGDKEAVLETLDEATASVEKRFKLVKLADRSEYGWDAANEYASDGLASDSEDEKKIKRAESAAAGKRKKKDEEKRRNSKKGRLEQGNSSRQFFRGSYGSYKQRRTNPADLCFGCGNPGHWRADCPNSTAGTPSFEFKKDY